MKLFWMSNAVRRPAIVAAPRAAVYSRPAAAPFSIISRAASPRSVPMVSFLVASVIVVISYLRSLAIRRYLHYAYRCNDVKSRAGQETEPRDEDDVVASARQAGRGHQGKER